MSLINHVRVPTLKDMESGILDTKHKVALFNAYLLSLIERAEFGDGLDRQQEFDRVNINKLIEKVSGLVLESDRLKLNLQKFNDICKEDSKQGKERNIKLKSLVNKCLLSMFWGGRGQVNNVFIKY